MYFVNWKSHEYVDNLFIAMKFIETRVQFKIHNLRHVTKFYRK